MYVDTSTPRFILIKLDKQLYKNELTNLFAVHLKVHVEVRSFISLYIRNCELLKIIYMIYNKSFTKLAHRVVVFLSYHLLQLYVLKM